METLKSVIDAIAQAFKGAKMPRSQRELAPLGIDAASVIKHFLGRTREEVEALGFFHPSLHVEDFSYMTPMGVEYYLSPVLRIMLREPWDSELWLYLGSYLRPREDGNPWWNLGELSKKQLLAMSRWALFLHEQWSPSPPDYIDPADAMELSEFYKALAGKR